MIPTIGVMVGLYILLRCCELFGSAATRFSSPAARVFVMVVALVCFLVTLFCTVDLVISSVRSTPSTTSGELIERRSPTQSRQQEAAMLQEIERRRLRDATK